MVKNKSNEYVVRSIRIPNRSWLSIKSLSKKAYRTSNSQIVMMIEDWLVDRGVFEETDRSILDEK